LTVPRNSQVTQTRRIIVHAGDDINLTLDSSHGSPPGPVRFGLDKKGRLMDGEKMDGDQKDKM